MNENGPLNPLVSVIIPVYNGERYLACAIDSVLRQEYHPFEIIVVDDGSVDRTGDIARGYADVQCIYQANQGQAAARNAGITAAVGELIAFLDHDDLWTPRKLGVHVAYLLDHPEVGYTISTGRSFLEEGMTRPEWVRPAELEEDQPLPGSLVVRKKVFRQLGMYDPSYRLAEDHDWLIRAEAAGIQRAIPPESVVRRRIHSANLSHDWRAGQRQVLRSLRAMLLRRRQQESATLGLKDLG